MTITNNKACRHAIVTRGAFSGVARRGRTHPFQSLYTHCGWYGRCTIAGVEAIACGGSGRPLLRLLILDVPLPAFVAKIQQ